MIHNAFQEFNFRVFYLLYWIAGFLTVGGAQVYAGFELSEVVSATSVLCICLFVCSIFVSQWFHYYLPKDFKYAWLLMVNVLTTGIALVVAHEIVNLTLDPSMEWLEYMASVRVWFIGFVFLYQLLVAILLVGWISKAEQQLQESQVREAEKLNREAELFLLHQQLQPHFMFNSLNSINALMGKRPEEAREMLTLLSAFLRGTIKSDPKPLVTFSEELRLIENYLAIERIRFSNRLVVELIYDFDAGSVFLPPLILQPLLENAIKYGLHSEDVAVPIVLKAILNDAGLQITITNPISKVNAAHGTGFGINGVQRRLYLLYRQTNLLGTEVLNHQFVVKLLIPQYTI